MGLGLPVVGGHSSDIEGRIIKALSSPMEITSMNVAKLKLYSNVSSLSLAKTEKAYKVFVFSEHLVDSSPVGLNLNCDGCIL